MRHKADPYVDHIAAWLIQKGRGLQADYSQALSFLQALDPSARSFSFRTFSDSAYTRRAGFDPLERALHGSLQACWDELLELNRRGAAVSVTINRTNGRGRTSADIERVRALFLDDDHPPEEVERFTLTPHIRIWTSPAHYHHYWLVEDLPRSAFPTLQRRLAQRYGGDDKVKALNQSMQLPGVWRRKRPCNPQLPRLQTINGFAAYTMRDLDRLFDP